MVANKGDREVEEPLRWKLQLDSRGYLRTALNTTVTDFSDTVLYGSKLFFTETSEVEEVVLKQVFHQCMMLVSTMTIHRTDHRSAGSGHDSLLTTRM